MRDCEGCLGTGKNPRSGYVCDFCDGTGLHDWLGGFVVFVAVLLSTAVTLGIGWWAYRLLVHHT